MTKRRQLQIAGTERTEVPEVEQAAEAYREVRDERSAMSKKEAQKKAELLAVMRAHKLKLYRYHDGNGEELEARIEDEPTVKVRKTGEAEPEVGEGVEVGPPRDGDVHPGLIEQALKAQADEANVEVNDEGDVQAPEKATPKKRGRKNK
jgi:hypothetical protein